MDRKADANYPEAAFATRGSILSFPPFFSSILFFGTRPDGLPKYYLSFLGPSGATGNLLAWLEPRKFAHHLHIGERVS